MNKIKLILFSISVYFLFGSIVALAQTAVTYPINELGNCKNKTECRTFCEDPLNRSACVDFAGKKGIYKVEEIQKLEEVALTTAKKELGCDSKDSCGQFCAQESNWERCGEFAKKNKLKGGKLEDPKASTIIDKAKQILGCGDYNGCKDYCLQPENHQKCSEFASLVGLNGGEVKVGPGGCTTDESCKLFCLNPDNFAVCQGYAQVTKSQFKGPGGCDSEESCKRYCLDNPNICRPAIQRSIQTPGLTPQDICLKTPNCSWKGSSCQCGSVIIKKSGDFCQEHPEACSQGGLPSNYNPTSFPGQGESKEIFCVRSGCQWKNNSCSCGTTVTPTKVVPTSTKAPTPTPSSSGGIPSNVTMSGSDGTWCYDPLGKNADGNTRMHTYYTCKDQNGEHSSKCTGNVANSPYCTGTWNGSSWSNVHCETSGGYTCSGSWGNACQGGVCVFTSSPTNTPAPAQSTSTPIPATPTPGNVGIGNSVQGVQTTSLLQKILDFFK